MLTRPRSCESEARSEMNWGKNLEHQAVEADDKIGAGQERIGIVVRQPVAARNVEGYR
jgi:hypothetical protein